MVTRIAHRRDYIILTVIRVKGYVRQGKLGNNGLWLQLSQRPQGWLPFPLQTYKGQCHYLARIQIGLTMFGYVSDLGMVHNHRNTDGVKANVGCAYGNQRVYGQVSDKSELYPSDLSSTRQYSPVIKSTLFMSCDSSCSLAVIKEILAIFMAFANQHQRLILILGVLPGEYIIEALGAGVDG